MPYDETERTILMVLDDGRTYSGINGCRIITVPDVWSNDQIEAALKGDEDLYLEIHVITTFHCRPEE